MKLVDKPIEASLVDDLKSELASLRADFIDDADCVSAIDQFDQVLLPNITLRMLQRIDQLLNASLKINIFSPIRILES